MKLRRLMYFIGAVAIAMAAAGASATPMTYRYSYTFNDGTVVGGTLVGEANGDYIDSVSDITLSVNGITQSGPFYLYGWSGSAGGQGWQPSAGRVSFDGTLNNLLFANDPPPLVGPTGYFYYVNSFDWCATASCTLVSIEDPTHFDASDVGATASRWLIAACEPFPGGGNTNGCFPGPGPFPAPEPSSMALMAVALAGLAVARRRPRAA